MVVQKAEKERAECLSFLLGKLPKGTWQKNARMLGMGVQEVTVERIPIEMIVISKESQESQNP